LPQRPTSLTKECKKEALIRSQNGNIYIFV